MTLLKYIQFNKTLLLSVLIFLSFAINVKGQQSVLAQGEWVKMTFETSGVYRVDFTTLSEMGIDPISIDPRNLAIYGIEGGMLPQSNAVNQPSDPTEISIRVFGENDGTFGPEDYILFYVDSPHKDYYNESTDTYEIEKNLYSNQIHYFLNLKNGRGQRIIDSPNISSATTPLTWYRQIIHHENDQVNLLTSGREWFGERFTTEDPVSFQYPVGSLTDNQSIKLTLSAGSQSFSQSSLLATLNDNQLGELTFQSIPNTQYGIKANTQSNVFQLPTNNIDGNQLNLNLTFNKGGQNNAVLYLNEFVLDVPADLSLNQELITIRNPEMLNNSISNFEIESSASDVAIWNTTSPIEVINQEYNLSNGTISFGAFTETLQEFIAFSLDQTLPVNNYERIDNQNIKALQNSDFIIITNPLFKNEAQDLASFRQSNNGLTSSVVTTKEIYNEFSAGRQDVSAIRNFLKYLYKSGNLKYALFFGKGSYDYLDRIEDNTNFVPTYESRNSIHPLLTYSSDDYFGFLDIDEGEWTENAFGDHELDIGIGRLPVANKEQAQTIVEKLIRYETDPRAFGDWRSKLLFIADDGDRNIHQRDADILATFVDTTYTQFQVDKLYLDQFEQVQLPNGEFSEAAQEELLTSVNDGALMINFTGHGAEFGWMQERILTFDLMEEWNNPFKLPFLITATCEFGRNDDPAIFSGAEFLLSKDDGGAIGLLTTTRPVFSSTNFKLNEALYDAVLEQENGAYLRLGDIIKYTKNNSLQGSLNRNFILLGDPSMSITYPEMDIVFDELNEAPLTGNDTIKAFQNIMLSGHIEHNNQIQNDFTGRGIISVFDKNLERETLGDESDPFTYLSREIELFTGEVSITNGEFDFEFVVPKNINYAYGNPRITIYASNNNNTLDASGALNNLILGGSSFQNSDSSGPTIRAFINDTTTSIAGEYENQLRLILKFEDESGINISPLGFGQDLKLILNDSIQFNLNDRYSANIDNYREGTVEISLKDLPKSTNTFLVEAWDNAGNSSVLTDQFDVQENTSYISEINNHPNPFNYETVFFVQHLLEGENIALGIDIHDRNGAKITTLYREYLSANSVLTLPWNGVNNEGQRLNKGIYIYTTKILSKTSGKTAIQRKKLIISN